MIPLPQCLFFARRYVHKKDNSTAVTQVLEHQNPSERIDSRKRKSPKSRKKWKSRQNHKKRKSQERRNQKGSAGTFWLMKRENMKVLDLEVTRGARGRIRPGFGQMPAEGAEGPHGLTW
jgi:hypothetical protein